jgi:hypothetical protein
MAETPFAVSTKAVLLDTLQKQEAGAGQLVTGLVKQIADDGTVANVMISKIKPAGLELKPLALEVLEGATDDEQRGKIAEILKAGNAPIVWTVICVQDKKGKPQKDVNVLLYRPDGGAWVKGLVQATAGLRDAIVDVAVAEWNWFGKQEVDVAGQKSAPGKQEDSDDGSERVALYWREGVGEPGITGKDHNKYWSAAFISYVMLKAGVGALFKRSDHHQEYIYTAMMAAMMKRDDYGYWGARLEDHAPELGDLICAWREKKITFEDAQKPGSYASHCDLVVARTDTTVTVIGGNVSQSVTRRTFHLNNGKVTPEIYPQTFAILVNRMPVAAEAAGVAKLLDEATAGKPSTPLPKVEFAPLGENAPIRGSFSITPPQIEKLCTGAKARYAFYAAAIAESSEKYGVNPLFVLADFVNQGVNEAYRNPWGISTDFYPLGPGGSQLGQPNGKVRNGPRKFGPGEWRIAFDRQFAVVATGKVYKNANTIAQWARIDAPPGAENDVGGTNAQEGMIVGALYNGLVQVLNA